MHAGIVILNINTDSIKISYLPRWENHSEAPKQTSLEMFAGPTSVSFDSEVKSVRAVPGHVCLVE